MTTTAPLKPGPAWHPEKKKSGLAVTHPLNGILVVEPLEGDPLGWTYIHHPEEFGWVNVEVVKPGHVQVRVDDLDPQTLSEWSQGRPRDLEELALLRIGRAFVARQVGQGVTDKKCSPALLDEIEAAAKKATPGRWQIDTEGECITGPGAALGSDVAGGVSIADAIHIATMEPATTLALVAEVRAQRAKVERVHEILNGPDYAEAQLGLIQQALANW